MRKNKTFLSLFCILFFMIGFSGIIAYAADSSMFIHGKTYELGEASAYDISTAKETTSPSFGKQSVGSLSIVGDIATQEDYEDVLAFGVNDSVKIRYIYDGTYNQDSSTWRIVSDNTETVNGIDISKDINEGAILVQKSSDGISWVDANAPTCNALKKNNIKEPFEYSMEMEDIMRGTFYKVLVAYKMERTTGDENVFDIGFAKDWAINKKDVKEYKTFVEEYVFFVCTNKNYVYVRDIDTKEALSNNSKIHNGFCVDLNGSYDKVTVKLDNGIEKPAKDFDSFTDPGKYTVTITTKLSKKYYYNLTVEGGLSVVNLSPTVMECEKNEGFINGAVKSGDTSYGIKSYTTLGIAQKSGFVSTKAKNNGFDAYGVNGDSASIYLRLNYSEQLSNSGWYVVSDPYGKKEKETINGTFAGAVGKGALIVRTSSDGTNWVDVNKDRYSNGLYTTDYATYYAPEEDVLIYTPKGNDVLSGVYIDVLFAYQVKNDDLKETIDCLEEYKFYLCSNELEAVTFHNLSIKDLKPYVGEDKESLEIYKKAETLVNNSGTVKGFKIDTSLNPTVKYEVKQNGKTINIPQNKEFYGNGKYDIDLISAVGDKNTVTIYVDNSSDEEALKNYFGDGFIDGKRIYDEASEYPVYEAGKGITKYHLEKVSDELLPISGVITNQTTGKEIKIAESRTERNGDILDAGDYVAEFRTGYSTSADAGDVRVFTFTFKVIENGTAPGPVVNYNNLLKYAETNISDCYPIYYGSSYPSANVGYITVAFAEEEAAQKFAYAYQKGMVEIQPDGTYRYNSSTADGQKVDFNSLWDLTDATNEASVKNVKRYAFDLSDEFTYRTLEDKETKNVDDLRSKKIPYSIIVFGDGQKNLLVSKASNDGNLPVISPKKYAYVQPRTDGKIISDRNDFEFINDKYGCDSYKVKVVDRNGKEYSIAYNKGVGQQLEKAKCPSGIVSIVEETVYGQSVTYEAIYIAPSDNTAKLSISYYDDGIEKKKEFSIEDNLTSLDVDAFGLESLEDELDPYSVVYVKSMDEDTFFSADDLVKKAWSEPETYEIKIVNRLGYSYSINVNVRESEYVVLSFTGDGTEELEDIVVKKDECNIALPPLSRPGYVFEGFCDTEGNVFTDTIAKLPNKSQLELLATWSPKKVNVIVSDIDGKVLSEETANYGSVYIAPAYETKEGYTFNGWFYNGTLLEDNKILISSEEDIHLIPSLVEVASGEEVVMVEKKHHAWPWIIILLFGGAAFVGYRRYTKGKRKDKEND